MRARVPASTANLGPGFDALGLALELYIEVSVEPADHLEIVTRGCGAGRFDDDRHLAVRVAKGVLGHDRLRVEVDSQIPVARGLGSSAALALAAAAAAGAPDPLAVAVGVDGHAENAAASRYGGLVVATVSDSTTIVEQLALDEALRFVLVVPENELSTSAAREALPTSVALRDATFNLSRVALLLTGLADHRRLRSLAMDDRLHQRYRAPLLPFADDVMSALRDGGALAACWSGAGSSLLGVALESTASSVAAAGSEALHRAGVAGDVHVLCADRHGLVVT